MCKLEKQGWKRFPPNSLRKKKHLARHNFCSLLRGGSLSGKGEKLTVQPESRCFTPQRCETANFYGTQGPSLSWTTQCFAGIFFKICFPSEPGGEKVLGIGEVRKEVAIPLNSALNPSGSRLLWSVFFCNESPAPLSAISPFVAGRPESFTWAVPSAFRVVGRRGVGRVFYALIKDR